MNKNFWTSWRRPQAAGLTLVEAAVGLAILGTLLVTVLTAGGRLAVQSRHAQEALEACRTADELMERLWRDREKLTLPAAGDVAGRKGWTWKLSAVRDWPEIRGSSGESQGQVAALEVFGPQSRTLAAARVELLLPRRNAEDGP